MIKNFNQFINESNETRGYIDYSYDIKTGVLNQIYSGKASELNIWGWYNDKGPVFPFPEGENEIKKTLESGKIILWSLSTSYNQSDIKKACSEWVKNNS